jgi:pimeloyl-ACP methyl ester carboxylesterase
VFGISFGGMVALEFAVTWPQRVERLAVACTSAGGAGGSSYPLHTIADLPADEQDALRLHLADRRYTPEFLAAHPFDQMLVDMAVAARATPKSDEQLRGERLQLEGRRQHDVWDRLGNITCPTSISYGEFDALAPPANSHALASRIADSQMRGFEGGHGFLFQDREAFPWVLDFLAGQA